MIKKIIIPVLCGTLLFSQATTFAAMEDMTIDIDDITDDIGVDDMIPTDLNESEYGITEPDELIPADVHFLVELDTEDPTQREKATEAIYSFSEEFIEPELGDEILEAYESLLDSLTLENNIMMGVDIEEIDTEGEGKVFITFKNTNNQFSLILALLGLNASLRQETYEGVNYYIISERDSSTEAYITRIDDIIAFTNISEAMEEIIDLALDSTNALSNDEDYNTITSNLAEVYVASIYVNITSILEILAEIEDEEMPPIMQIADKLAIALTLEDDGWYFTTYTLGNESVIDELGLPFDLTDFTPNIYQKFPAAPTIFYTETENLGASVQGMLNTLLEDYGYDPGVATETALGLNLETEILAWMDKELAIGMQDSGEIIPALTVMINASSSPINAQKLIDFIDGFINALMIGDREIVTKESVEIDGGTLYNVKIDLIGILEEQEGIDSEKLALLETILPPLELTYGLTGEDLLIFSNYPALPDHYGEGLNSNEDVETMMTRVPPENGGFSYLSPAAFFDYTNRILETFDRVFPGEIDPEFLNGYYDLQELLYKFQDIITTQTNQRYERGEKIFIRIDETAQPPEYTYETEVESKKEADSDEDGRSDYEEEYIHYTNPYAADELVQMEFEDVPEGEWYSPHVHSLANEGAIKGYETEEGTNFKPNEPITRAEFTKIVLESFDYSIKTAEKQTFYDVHPQDWHYDYVYTAQQKGLVKGYPDNTFHPNDPITRAEGLKIVLEAYGYYEATAAPAPFTDTKDHWAEPYINYGYSEDVVSGVSTTSFEPDRPITRAEAAKIVNEVNKLQLEQIEETSAPAQYTEKTLDIFVDTLF